MEEDPRGIFPIISGHVSLDLINTEVIRWGVRHDLLVMDHLSHWIDLMRRSGSLVGIKEDSTYQSKDLLRALQELRAYLRKGFEGLAKGETLDRSWGMHLEELIEKAPFTYQVTDDGLVPVPVGHPMDQFLSLIAFNALDLLTNGELKRLRFCSNPACILLFIDHTGRRKWCSMKICGNRVKVARYQSRKRGEKEI